MIVSYFLTGPGFHLPFFYAHFGVPHQKSLIETQTSEFKWFLSLHKVTYVKQ